ncbi:hypothetical protein SAMN04487914_1234 [Arthrobacter sp. ok909]|nr:hypothetical protein SAMN04487914_1234 [Arthrobacter sp. ok909]
MTYVVFVYAGTLAYLPVTNASFGKYSAENLNFTRGSQFAGYYLVGVGANETFPTNAPGYDTVQTYTDSVDPNLQQFNVHLSPTPTPPPPPPPPPPAPAKHGDHFYTTSSVERDNAVQKYGYQKEGIACYIFDTQQPGTDALYRLLNSQNGDHFYTTSAFERDNAVQKYGYHSEGVAGYVYVGQQTGTSPFYRLLNSQNGDHFYTTSAFERDNAVQKYGYHNEGVACFVFTDQQAGTTPLYRLVQA